MLAQNIDKTEYKEATKKTVAETKSKKVTENIIRGWNDAYLKYNMNGGKKDLTGRYQIEYDAIAEKMLGQEQDKATLHFDDKTSRMNFMLDNGYYRNDLLRDNVSMDDVEDLYKVYNDNDIGFTRFYSRLVFIISFAFKVTDVSLYRLGLNKLIEFEKRSVYERELITVENKMITPEMIEKVGIPLTESEIKAIENGFKINNDELSVTQLNNLYTDEILEVLGLTRKSLPKSRYDEKYILLEDRADRAIAHALDIVGGKPFTIKDVANSIKQQATREFQASTPSFANAGLANGGEKISCTILKIDDTLPSIRDRIGDVLMLSKKGAGIGISASNVRATGEYVGELDNRAHGAIKLAKMVESNVQYADQNGKRVGSAVYNIDVFNADYKSLLDAKKENVDESVRLTMLSIGLVFRDKFFELYLKGEEGFYTFYPHTIVQEYGISLTDVDMNEMYEELVSNPRIRKDYVTFESFISDIGEAVSESGYPYPLFRDNMSREHIFKDETVNESNLCTEIIQSLTSDRAIQCNLASLDVAQVMTNKSLRIVASTLVRHLNGVMDNTDFSEVPTVQRGMDERRAIGIGTANLQGYFASKGIPYESDIAIDFARVFYSQLNYYSLKESMELVKNGTYPKFVGFENTTLADGTYFDKYLVEEFVPTTDKVKEEFEGMEIITSKDWKQLKEDVMKYGVANAYRLAIAPNGTTSYSMGGTAGITPNTQLVESRKTASMGSALYPMPSLEDTSTYFMYKDAYRVDDFKYFDLVSTIQNHIDQGISTTIFITDEYTTADWWTRVVYAWKIGLKTLYYTRPKISGIVGKDGQEIENHEECESCSG